MSFQQWIKTFPENSRNCPACKKPLPAHKTWPGKRRILCGSAECDASFSESGRMRYVRPQAETCSAANCRKHIPSGWYGRLPERLTCSSDCWLQIQLDSQPVVFCGCGCGERVERIFYRKNVGGLSYVSMDHYFAHLRATNLSEACGAFRAVVEEYLNGFATIYYANPIDTRSHLLPFFRYLTERGFTVLDEVDPKAITDYLVWGKEKGVKGVAYSTGAISTLFNWLIAEGRRQKPNPVINSIHKGPVGHLQPRPLEKEELELMWKILDERGNERLRLIAAIGEEAGLRCGEICNLRISDVDLTRRRLFVRIPNKTRTERWAYFSEKTVKYFTEWMAVRRPDCGHDYVLHNFHGGPLQRPSVTEEFNKTLCKKYKGKVVHESGFDNWSTHRLRHTMASNLVAAGADAATVMAAGGWKCHDSMAGYARVDPDLARRGYDEAMRRAKDQEAKVNRKRVLNPKELLQMLSAEQKGTENADEQNDCV